MSGSCTQRVLPIDHRHHKSAPRHSRRRHTELLLECRSTRHSCKQALRHCKSSPWSLIPSQGRMSPQSVHCKQHHPDSYPSILRRCSACPGVCTRSRIAEAAVVAIAIGGPSAVDAHDFVHTHVCRAPIGCAGFATGTRLAYGGAGVGTARGNGCCCSAGCCRDSALSRYAASGWTSSAC